MPFDNVKAFFQRRGRSMRDSEVGTSDDQRQRVQFTNVQETLWMVGGSIETSEESDEDDFDNDDSDDDNISDDDDNDDVVDGSIDDLDALGSFDRKVEDEGDGHAGRMTENPLSSAAELTSTSVKVQDIYARYAKLKRDYIRSISTSEVSCKEAHQTQGLVNNDDGNTTENTFSAEWEDRVIEMSRVKRALDLTIVEIKKDPKVERVKKMYLLSDDYELFDQRLTQDIRSGRIENVKIKMVAHDLYADRDITKIQTSGTLYPPLHYALLFGNEVVMDFLIILGGELLATNGVNIQDWIQITPLQLAILSGKFSMVRSLVEAVESEDRRRDYINRRVKSATHKQHSFHELILAEVLWSATEDNSLSEVRETFLYLVKNGADLAMKSEKEGHTILHLLVIQVLECLPALEVYREFLSVVFSEAAHCWWLKSGYDSKWALRRSMSYLLSLENHEGLTPIALAAEYESPLYLDLVRWDKVMLFADHRATGFAATDTFDVTSLVSIGKDGWYQPNSAMHVLAHNRLDPSKTFWRHDIVDTEPMKTLIKRKWHFYSPLFYAWGSFHIIYMTIFTICTLGLQLPFTRSPMPSNVSFIGNHTIGTFSGSEVHPRNPCFVGFLAAPLLYLLSELSDIVSHKRTFKVSYTITGNAVYRLLSAGFSFFTALWFLLYMVRSDNADVALGMSLLQGWLFCIFFTRTITYPNKTSQIGAFSIMVQRMLIHDVLPFMLVSFFIILSFATAIHATLSLSSTDQQHDSSFTQTFYRMLKYLSALDEPMNEQSSRVKDFAKALLSMYGIIIAVLLLNILIAAMNKSYEAIRKTRLNLVARQRLAIMLLIERRFTAFGRYVQDKAGVEIGVQPWSQGKNANSRFYLGVKRQPVQQIQT